VAPGFSEEAPSFRGHESSIFGSSWLNFKVGRTFTPLGNFKNHCRYLRIVAIPKV